jgi:hypothetical protein
MGVLDLVGKAAKGAKKAAPFFSKADIVLDELPRGKGLGNEFLGELVKKGAKPTELRDRGIEKALKDKPKMTKAEVQKIFEEKAPPKVQEKVLSSESPDYEDFLEAKAQEEYGIDWFDLNKQEKARLEKMFRELPTTQYEQYRTPGGENYREILLKLPKRGLTKLEQDELMLYEADLRRTEGKATPERMARYQELKAKEPENAQNYTSGHYREDPNLLAHIRVQDFQAPTRGFAVINTRSGNRSEVFPSMEQAQAYLAQMPENMQGMLRIDEAAGKPKKVLLVDEIQSDWHQEGRKKGYGPDKTQQASVGQQDQYGWPVNLVDGQVLYKPDEQSARVFAEQINARGGSRSQGVPDAPFKKNWHELAMKRVLDYAAENGYDSIAITPGAEQAKRYDLSKQISKIDYNKFDSGQNELKAWDKDGKKVFEKYGASQEEVADYIGKEAAEKLFAATPKDNHMGGQRYSLIGEDLQVGGEGMKGFYDKILPDYLNNFGKQYGSSVGQMDLITKPEKKIVNIMDPDEPDISPAEMMKFHSFDITPQLRDEVKAKGLPLYSKTGMGPEGLAAGSGAATIGSQMFDENNEQQVQNPVHFTENPDAMLLELMQRN